MQTAICRWCNVPKSIEHFKPEKRVSTGHDCVCRECRAEKQRKDRQERPEVFHARDAKQRQLPAHKSYQKAYYEANKEQILRYCSERRLNDLDAAKAREKEQRDRRKREHGDEIAAYQKEYRRQNRPKLAAQQTRRYHTDLNHKVKHLVACSILKLLGGRIKQSKTLDYLGCTIEYFRGYIAAKFQDGMSWDNHGSVWHLDHKIPCRAFDVTKEDQLYACFNYTNYQPLFAADNLSKCDKLPCGTPARRLHPKSQPDSD